MNEKVHMGGDLWNNVAFRCRWRFVLCLSLCSCALHAEASKRDATARRPTAHNPRMLATRAVPLRSIASVASSRGALAVALRGTARLPTGRSFLGHPRAVTLDRPFYSGCSLSCILFLAHCQVSRKEHMRTLIIGSPSFSRLQ